MLSVCDELALLVSRMSIGAKRREKLSQIAQDHTNDDRDIQGLTLEAAGQEACLVTAEPDAEQDERGFEACLSVATVLMADELGELATMVENALSLEYRDELRLVVYLAVTQRQVRWEGYENMPEAIAGLGRETWLTRIRRHWLDYPAVVSICVDLFDRVEEMTPA